MYFCKSVGYGFGSAQPSGYGTLSIERSRNAFYRQSDRPTESGKKVDSLLKPHSKAARILHQA